MILEILTLLCIQFLGFSDAEVYAIKYNSEFYFEEFTDVAATFGPSLAEGSVRGMLVNATPPSACSDSLKPPPSPSDNDKWILLVPRYSNDQNCTFEQKIRMAQLKQYRLLQPKDGWSTGLGSSRPSAPSGVSLQSLGQRLNCAIWYDAVIVYNVGSNDLVPMSAKNASGIQIPSVFVSQSSGNLLRNVYTDPKYFIVITAETPFNIQTHLLIPFAIVVGICFVVMIIFMVVKYIKDRRRQRRHRLPKSQLNKIPTCKYQKGDRYDTCAICLEDYIEGEKLRVLPCSHVYHIKCIDPWLTKNKRVCPICKRKVFAQDEPHHDSDSDSDTDDTTPLLRSGSRVTTGGTFEVQNENPIQRAARSVSQQSGAANFVTASDHHSINGDRQSISSSDSGATTDSSTSANEVAADRPSQLKLCNNLEVHVHQPDASSDDTRSDITV